MTLNFDIDMGDMMSFQKHYVNTSSSMKKAKRLIAYLFPLFIFIFGLISFYNKYNKIDTSFIIIMIVISALWVIFMPRFFINRTLNQSKKKLLKPGNEIMFGAFEMVFTDSGLDVKTTSTTSSLQWNAIVKVDETDNYFYLYLSQVSAYIVPKKKISITEVEDLRTMLQTHLLK